LQYSELGRTGLKVSRCCLGTMMWGGPQNDEALGHEQMDYALTRGVTFWDTSEMYAIPPHPKTQGNTERIIGNWFAKNPGKRSEVILASKVAGRSPMTWLRKDGSGTRQTKAQIDEAVESSLQRLQTDYIDLYQLHWPDRAVRNFGGMTFQDYDGDYERFETILESLNAHVQKGNIRHVGVSNETPYGVMKFVEASERLGLPRMASIQNAYNLVNRVFEFGLAEIAMREQVGLLAYSPVGQGYLIGKYLDGARPEGARTTMFNRGQRYEGPGAEKAIRSYVELARDKGLTPAQLAIKFCDSRPFVTSTIIGGSTMEQLKEDIDAFDTAWSGELETAVDALHVEQPNPCP
jgi:aryl-alcohol dehydrogenase-like predicted oxidoreductase